MPLKEHAVKKMLARTLIFMVITVGVGMAGVRGAQGQQDCVLDTVCLYEDIDFDGQLWLFDMSTPDVGDDVTDQASSVFNNTVQPVTLYREEDFGGFPPLCLNPGTGIRDLGDLSDFSDLSGQELDDDISSLELAIGFCAPSA
ncbi:MAG: peptidase inhibitor family I36 protein [Egibacteraceae bacterium]